MPRPSPKAFRLKIPIPTNSHKNMNQDLERLRLIKSFPSLVKYLRDELDWPIESDDVENLSFDYQPEELGLDPKTAVKIKRLSNSGHSSRTSPGESSTSISSQSACRLLRCAASCARWSSRSARRPTSRSSAPGSRTICCSSRLTASRTSATLHSRTFRKTPRWGICRR